MGFKNRIGFSGTGFPSSAAWALEKVDPMLKQTVHLRKEWSNSSKRLICVTNQQHGKINLLRPTDHQATVGAKLRSSWKCQSTFFPPMKDDGVTQWVHSSDLPTPKQTWAEYFPHVRGILEDWEEYMTQQTNYRVYTDVTRQNSMIFQWHVFIVDL